MRLGVLFSGGKDSSYALYEAMKTDDVVCLISILSRNPESYMFHTPNISLVRLQAEASGIPLIEVETEGVKERELSDLEEAICRAKKEHNIGGIVTGAVESVYQSERIQRICDKLDLYCFNPLWKKDQEELLREIVKAGFDVIVSGVFAHPMDRSWLGRRLDDKAVDELVSIGRNHRISPSGEGGEIETTVLDAPFFKGSIAILKSRTQGGNDSGTFVIEKAELVKK